MTEQARDAVAADVAELMTRYSFDVEGHSLNCWIEQWLEHYPAGWIPGAVVEALYQGRYKAISVWQILDLWRRRGKPLQHFNREFERMVSGRSIHLLFTPLAMPQSVIAVPSPLLVGAEANGHRSMPQGRPPRHTYSTNVSTPSIHSNQSHLASTKLASMPVTEAAALILPPQTAADLFPADPAPIQPFQPPEQFKLTLPGEISRTRSSAANYPIQQFVPTPESSDFHDKLKTIAQALTLTNAQAISSAMASRKALPVRSEQDPGIESAELDELNPAHRTTQDAAADSNQADS